MHKAFWFPWIYLPFILLDYIDFTCPECMYLYRLQPSIPIPTYQQYKYNSIIAATNILNSQFPNNSEQ